MDFFHLFKWDNLVGELTAKYFLPRCRADFFFWGQSTAQPFLKRNIWAFQIMTGTLMTPFETPLKSEFNFYASILTVVMWVCSAIKRKCKAAKLLGKKPHPYLDKTLKPSKTAWWDLKWRRWPLTCPFKNAENFPLNLNKHKNVNMAKPETYLEQALMI